MMRRVGSSRALILFSTTPRVSFDADAAAFFSTAGITNAAEKSAVNTLVLSLKSNSLWDKMDRIYPFSPTGLSASTYCVKSLTQMVYANSPTHSSTGVTFDGATQYADTEFDLDGDSSIILTASAHLSCYVNANTSGFDATRFYMGQNDGTNAGQIGFLSSGNGRARFWTATSQAQAAQAAATGFLVGSRTTNLIEYYRNTTLVGNDVTVSGAIANTWSCYIGAQNTIGSIGNPMQGTFAFASIGSGLTSAECGNLYTAVQAYQTALSRTA